MYALTLWIPLCHAEIWMTFVCGKEQTKNMPFFNNLTHRISGAQTDQLLLHTPSQIKYMFNTNYM